MRTYNEKFDKKGRHYLGNQKINQLALGLYRLGRNMEETRLLNRYKIKMEYYT